MSCGGGEKAVSSEEEPPPTPSNPEAYDINIETRESTPIEVQLESNYSEISFEIVSGPENGFINFYTDYLDYFPNDSFNGEDIITYKAIHQILGESNVATISINVTDRRTFGNSNNDMGYSVKETSDNGYIIAGKSWISSTYKGIILKTDYDGILEWSNTFSVENKKTVFSELKITSDGGFVVAGTAYNGNDKDIIVLKTDNYGNELWRKIIDNQYSDEGMSIHETSDGGFVVSGTSLVKLSSGGNIIWNKSFNSSGNSIVENNEGNLIILGYSSENTYTIQLTKTDSSGNEIWKKTFGAGKGKSIKPTNDGGYILGIESNSGNNAMTMIKVNSDGDQEWSNSHASQYGQSYLSDIEQTSDGGYILGGYVTTSRDNDMFFVKTDSNGNLEWNKTIGAPLDGENDQLWSIIETSDQNYILLGETNGYGYGLYDIYLIKLDNVGNEVF